MNTILAIELYSGLAFTIVSVVIACLPGLYEKLSEAFYDWLD